MFIRFTAFILFSSTFCFASLSQSHSAETALQLKPAYTTVHGGLKVVHDPPVMDMPRLGLALAGGGAKAAAAIGVLKVFEEEGIPVAAIAGTSMGAGVGGLFAAGYKPAEIERIFLENDWNDIFNDKPARAFLTQEQKAAGSRHLLEFTFQQGRFMPPYGFTAGQKLTNLLAEKALAASFAAELDFDRLHVPFRAIATDIENGDAVVLADGLLHEAIRASTAIPMVFQPVEIGNRLLVDGGLVNNLPVEVARSMGSDIVIAIDSSARLEKKEQLVSLVEIMSQSISLPVRRESERQAALADLVIMPDTSDYSFTDFPSMKIIIARGEDAARAALPRIRELLKPRKRAPDIEDRFHVTSLVIQGNETVPDAALRSTMNSLFVPEQATASDLRKALVNVYQLGAFSDVSLIIQPEGGAHHALLTVIENPVIKSVSVAGNTVISSASILSGLDWQIGRPMNTTRLVAELDLLVARYHGEGFLLARVQRTCVKPDGTLEIVMDEGRVDSIGVIGRTKVSRSLIQRETLTRTGQPLNLNIAASDIQRLYALDYFESIGVDVTRSPQGGLDLTLKFKEKPTNKIRLGLRYDLEDYFTGLTDIIVDNVGGRGVKLFLNTRYGNYSDVTFGYRSPVVLRTNFLHTVDAFYRDRNYFIYENKRKVEEIEITRKGVEIAFGYQWFRFGDTYLRYRYASDTTAAILGIDPPQEIARIGSWAFLSSIDTRDSSTFAHRGTLFKIFYEKADPSYAGTVNYTKTTLSAQGFFPIGERHTAMLEARGGSGSGSIPYVEKYGLGGADYLISQPLLGYERREFIGDSLLTLSSAYRFKIYDYQLSLVKAVYLKLAYQRANVWNTKNDMSLRDMRSGAGIGLHADTVVGPVRLDFGKGEDHRYSVYFSAGFDF